MWDRRGYPNRYASEPCRFFARVAPQLQGPPRADLKDVTEVHLVRDHDALTDLAGIDPVCFVRVSHDYSPSPCASAAAISRSRVNVARRAMSRRTWLRRAELSS